MNGDIQGWMDVGDVNARIDLTAQRITGVIVEEKYTTQLVFTYASSQRCIRSAARKTRDLCLTLNRKAETQQDHGIRKAEQ
jgi:hypothetical protein